MADRTIISWNFTNWVTVVLMAAVGFGALAVVTNLIAKRRAAAAPEQGA